MISTKGGKFQQKSPLIIHSWSNQFWNPISNISVTLQNEKPQPKNLPRDEKTHSNERRNYFH